VYVIYLLPLDRWYEFDDTRVSLVEGTAIVEFLERAYILFLSKEDGDEDATSTTQNEHRADPCPSPLKKRKLSKKRHRNMVERKRLDDEVRS